MALKAAVETYGAKHTSITKYLYNLAETYYANDEYEKAVPLLQRAIDIKKQDEGNDQLSIASYLNLLAKVYDLQAKDIDAESCYLRALKIWEKSYGRNDTLFVVPVLRKIEKNYEKQGKIDSANKIKNRIKSIVSKDNKIEILTAKRDNLFRQGNYNKAEKIGKQVVVLSEEVFGKDHIFVALDLDELAKIYKAQNRFDKAEPIYKRELEIWKKTRAPDHIRAIETMKNLMITYEKLGNIEKMREIEGALNRINKKR